MSPLPADLLALVAIVICLILALAWLASGQMVARRRPDPACTPEDFGLPLEEVRFDSRDGIALGGWLTGEGGRRPVIVFCAGMFGSMDGDTKLLPPLIAAGFDVLQFDWRGHGISAGGRNTLALRETLDLLGAIDYLQSRGVRRMGLLGFSMGGGVALRVAAEDERVACVVCDGGFVDIGHAFEGYVRERTRLPVRPLLWLAMRMAEWRLGTPLREASPLPHVARISPRPVCFIYGDADPIVPRADQDAIYAACGEPKSLWRVESVGHREIHEKQPAEYVERVIGFFKRYLR